MDRVHIGKSLSVAPDETVGDVVCLFCSVYVPKGAAVHGDVATIFGSVFTNGNVHGNMASIFGSVHLGDGVSAHGDVASLFGSIFLGSGASTHGNIATVFGSYYLQNAKVNGDAAAIFGAGNIDSGSSIHGDAAAVFGRVHHQEGSAAGHLSEKNPWSILLVLLLVSGFIWYVITSIRHRTAHP